MLFTVARIRSGPDKQYCFRDESETRVIYNFLKRRVSRIYKKEEVELQTRTKPLESHLNKRQGLVFLFLLFLLRHQSLVLTGGPSP